MQYLKFHMVYWYHDSHDSMKNNVKWKHIVLQQSINFYFATP